MKMPVILPIAVRPIGQAPPAHSVNNNLTHSVTMTLTHYTPDTRTPTGLSSEDGECGGWRGCKQVCGSRKKK